MRKVELKKIPYELTVCKVADISAVDINADYILVKEENFELALNVLEAEGYSVV